VKYCHPLLILGALAFSNPRPQLVTEATHFAWIGLFPHQWLKSVLTSCPFFELMMFLVSVSSLIIHSVDQSLENRSYRIFDLASVFVAPETYCRRTTSCRKEMIKGDASETLTKNKVWKRMTLDATVMFLLFIRMGRLWGFSFPTHPEL